MAVGAAGPLGVGPVRGAAEGGCLALGGALGLIELAAEVVDLPLLFVESPLHAGEGLLQPGDGGIASLAAGANRGCGDGIGHSRGSLRTAKPHGKTRFIPSTVNMNTISSPGFYALGDWHGAVAGLAGEKLVL